jgi:hypothetical protein
MEFLDVPRKRNKQRRQGTHKALVEEEGALVFRLKFLGVLEYRVIQIHAVIESCGYYQRGCPYNLKITIPN